MPKRIRLFMECSSVQYSTEDFIDAPEDWDEMTDDEKDAFMEPIVQGLIDNEISAGWDEES